MSPLVDSLQSALASGNVLALPIALAGGVVVGFNPCCLALYPAAGASCCAGAVADRTRSAAPIALALVAGTVIATTLVGMLAALAGHDVGGYGRWPRYAMALVPLVMGTHLIGWIRLPLPTAHGTRRSVGLASAFAAGFALAFVVGSCGTPVLAALLAYVAYQGKVLFGAALLSAYGLGTAVPLLAAGIGAAELARRAGRAAPWTERAIGLALGLALVAFGFYLILTVA